MHPAALKKFRESIRRNQYELTIPHFLDALAEDDLTIEDAENAVLKGRVTRRFLGDARGVRYRITGPALDGSRVSVIARIKETGIPLLITIYRDDEKR